MKTLVLVLAVLTSLAAPAVAGPYGRICSTQCTGSSSGIGGNQCTTTCY